MLYADRWSGGISSTTTPWFYPNPHTWSPSHSPTPPLSILAFCSSDGSQLKLMVIHTESFLLLLLVHVHVECMSHQSSSKCMFWIVTVKAHSPITTMFFCFWVSMVQPRYCSLIMMCRGLPLGSKDPLLYVWECPLSSIQFQLGFIRRHTEKKEEQAKYGDDMFQVCWNMKWTAAGKPPAPSPV